MKFKKEFIQQIIQEEIEKEITEQQEINKQLSVILEDVQKMKESGASRQQINEEIWKRAQLNEGILDKLLQLAKEWLGRQVVQVLGFSEDGLIARTFINTIGNMGLDEWLEVIKGDCNTITDQLLKGFTESLSEKYVIEKLADILGIDKDGMIYSVVFPATRESISEWINELVKDFRDPLKKMVCEFDLESLMGGSGFLDKLGGKVMQAAASAE